MNWDPVTPMDANRLLGGHVHLSPFLTEPKTVERTRRERWLSWPWRPWVRTKVIQVPSRQVLQMGRSFLVHPEFWPVLRKELAILAKDRT